MRQIGFRSSINLKPRSDYGPCRRSIVYALTDPPADSESRNITNQRYNIVRKLKTSLTSKNLGRDGNKIIGSRNTSRINSWQQLV